MTLTPAYGRDYKSKAKVLEDFDAGKDFVINDITSRWDGKPATKEELKASGVKSVQIRYGQLRKVCVVKL